MLALQGAAGERSHNHQSHDGHPEGGPWRQAGEQNAGNGGTDGCSQALQGLQAAQPSPLAPGSQPPGNHGPQRRGRHANPHGQQHHGAVHRRLGHGSLGMGLRLGKADQQVPRQHQADAQHGEALLPQPTTQGTNEHPLHQGCHHPHQHKRTSHVHCLPGQHQTEERHQDGGEAVEHQKKQAESQAQSSHAGILQQLQHLTEGIELGQAGQRLAGPGGQGFREQQKGDQEVEERHGHGHGNGQLQMHVRQPAPQPRPDDEPQAERQADEAKGAGTPLRWGGVGNDGLGGGGCSSRGPVQDAACKHQRQSTHHRQPAPATGGAPETGAHTKEAHPHSRTGNAHQQHGPPPKVIAQGANHRRGQELGHGVAAPQQADHQSKLADRHQGRHQEGEQGEDHAFANAVVEQGEKDTEQRRGALPTHHRRWPRADPAQPMGVLIRMGQG